MKSAALASFKLGTIASACYGAYKWTVGSEVVHTNDFMAQTESDFLEFKNQAIVTRSVENLIDSMYQKRPIFKKWVPRAKEFFSHHLAREELMSGAIVKHLLEKASSKRDFTFETYAVKTCRLAPSSSQSCMRVAEFYMGDSNPDALSNAVSLVVRCKDASNAFCEKALEQAKALSLSQKEFRLSFR